MKAHEISLSQPREFEFPDGECAFVESCRCDDGWQDCLRVKHPSTGTIILRSAVDVSERLQSPRIFLFEGDDDLSVVLTFGGETSYHLRSNGVISNSLATFRTRGYEEYWETTILHHGDLAVIVYESGLMAIDRSLRQLWQKRKYFDDRQGGIEGNKLTIVRNHEIAIHIRIEDGEILNGPRTRSADDLREP